MSCRLVAIGGALSGETASFTGADALRSVRAHHADRAFVSLVSVEPAEAEIRRAMIAQSASAAPLDGDVLVRLTHSAPVHA